MSEGETELGRVLAAYAGATSGDLLDAAAVRGRVLRALRAPHRRGPSRLRYVLPLVATFAASGAFAASRPALRQAVSASLRALFAAGPSLPAPSPRPQRGHAPATKASEVSGPGGAAEASRRVSPAPLAVDELPLAPSVLPPNPTRSAEVTRASAPGPSSPVADDAQLEAYRRAHRIHFDGSSPLAALAAWDRYLADYPAGSFNDDARFNRALCLVRLGRSSQARAALRPFAAAPPGSYRQAEASSLLRGLSEAQ